MHHDMSTIGRGWSIHDANDEKIGDVADVGGNYVLVQKGLLFVKDLYVPFDAVTQVDEARQRAYVNVDKGDVDALGWDQPPAESDRIDDAVGGGAYATETVTSTEPVAAAGHEDDAARVRLHEERLEAARRREQTGEVDVSKRVVASEQTLEVPVEHDELHVRRVRVDRDATADEPAFTDEGDTIRVPMTAETVEVTKTPRVVEEIEISKRPVTERQQVSDTVRREEVEVQREGDVRLVEDGAHVDGSRSGDLVGAGSDRFQRTSIDDITGDDELDTRR